MYFMIWKFYFGVAVMLGELLCIGARVFVFCKIYVSDNYLRINIDVSSNHCVCEYGPSLFEVLLLFRFFNWKVSEERVNNEVWVFQWMHVCSHSPVCHVGSERLLYCSKSSLLGV